jgi:hypothetical protein
VDSCGARSTAKNGRKSLAGTAMLTIGLMATPWMLACLYLVTLSKTRSGA